MLASIIALAQGFSPDEILRMVESWKAAMLERGWVVTQYACRSIPAFVNRDGGGG
jgi:hypothetical protein